MPVIASTGGLSLPRRFGTGKDGEIIIRSGYTINIKELYENDNLTGVKTHRGENKGLNYGSTGTLYTPKNNQINNNGSNVINAVSFLIESGATLISNGVYQDYYNALNENNGIIWISTISSFECYGDIDLTNIVGGGAKGPWTSDTGYGAGPGIGYGASHSGPGYGGESYGTQDLDMTTWSHIFGSGGSSARDERYSGGVGGYGAGALRIYAASKIYFDNSANVYCNGQIGGSGASSDAGASGAGGAGSGGSVFLESLGNVNIGSSVINVNGGPWQYDIGDYDNSQYPKHSGGGGGAGFATNGSNGERAQTKRAGVGGGASNGRIAIKSNNITGTAVDSVSYYQIT